MSSETKNIISVKNLTTMLWSTNDFILVNNDISFDVREGEWLGIMGPSGSGKSVLAQSISGIFTGKPGIVYGNIFYDGNDLLKGLNDNIIINRCNGRIESVEKKIFTWKRLYQNNYRLYAKNAFAYIFQNPYHAFNPYLTVRHHFSEVLKNTTGTRAELEEKSCSLLEKIGFDEPKTILRSYTHEMNGGKTQRVALCLALAQGASVIVADECTSFLDPMASQQTLRALQKVKDENNCTIIFITHDIELVKRYSCSMLTLTDGVITDFITRQGSSC